LKRGQEHSAGLRQELTPKSGRRDGSETHFGGQHERCTSAVFLPPSFIHSSSIPAQLLLAFAAGLSAFFINGASFFALICRILHHLLQHIIIPTSLENHTRARLFPPAPVYYAVPNRLND
jgi:hypothetical protein